MLHSSQVCSEVDSTYRGPSKNKPGCNQINTPGEFSSQKRRKKWFFTTRLFFTHPDCSYKGLSPSQLNFKAMLSIQTVGPNRGILICTRGQTNCHVVLAIN